MDPALSQCFGKADGPSHLLSRLRSMPDPVSQTTSGAAAHLAAHVDRLHGHDCAEDGCGEQAGSS